MQSNSEYSDEELKKRWQKKAGSYPKYSDSLGTIDDQIFSAIKEAGIDFTGKTVLDIGCGTGIYTIRAAKEAASVTGTDISDEMLSILKQDAHTNGCHNIDTVLTSWNEFDYGTTKWDIVMSAMTPAIRTEKDYEKASSYASESVIFLGWGGKREPEIIVPIINKTNGKANLFNNSSVIKQWLESQGIPFFSKTFDETRKKIIPIKDAYEYCADALDAFGIHASSSDIYPLIDQFKDNDDNVVFNISSRFELIVRNK